MIFLCIFSSKCYLLGWADGYCSFLAFIDKPATSPGGTTKMITLWHCSHFIFISLRLVSHLSLFSSFTAICWIFFVSVFLIVLYSKVTKGSPIGADAKSLFACWILDSRMSSFCHLLCSQLASFIFPSLSLWSNPYNTELLVDCFTTLMTNIGVLLLFFNVEILKKWRTTDNLSSVAFVIMREPRNINLAHRSWTHWSWWVPSNSADSTIQSY